MHPGYKVLSAADGEQALGFCETEKYSENVAQELQKYAHLQKPYSPVSPGRVLREILDSEARANSISASIL
jgi:hypothetical protein